MPVLLWPVTLPWRSWTRRQAGVPVLPGRWRCGGGREQRRQAGMPVLLWKL